MSKQLKPNTAKDDSRCLRIKASKSDDPKKVLAATLITPSIQAASTIQLFSADVANINMMSLTEALSDQVETAQTGDLSRMEMMLVMQAHTLDTLFNTLACRAKQNMGEYIDATDRYMRLALRAQSQCRSTIEAISTIKNPPRIGYIEQANISSGHQQINNQPNQVAPDKK